MQTSIIQLRGTILFCKLSASSYIQFDYANALRDVCLTSQAELLILVACAPYKMNMFHSKTLDKLVLKMFDSTIWNPLITCA